MRCGGAGNACSSRNVRLLAPSSGLCCISGTCGVAVQAAKSAMAVSDIHLYMMCDPCAICSTADWRCGAAGLQHRYLNNGGGASGGIDNGERDCI